MTDVYDDADSHRRPYKVTPYFIMKWIDSFFEKTKITSEDGIIDLGCGAGAMMFYFKQQSFGKVAGLEFSQKIADMCGSNIRKWNIDVDLIVADANQYTEYDEFNYFYIFDAFDGDIIKQVIRNINTSIERKPRNIVVIYTLDRFKELFLDDGYTVKDIQKRNIFHKSESVVLEKVIRGN